MKRRILALALGGAAVFGNGAAAHASPLCVLQKVCLGIQIHCPTNGGPPPACLCVDQYVSGYHVKQCVL